MKKGWEIMQLGDTCEIVNGGTPKSKVSNYWDGDVQWVTPKDLGQLNGRYIDNTPRKISELGLKKSSAKLFPKKSVILSTRAPIGHLAINLVEMATNQGCRGIVPKKNLFTEYLYFYLSNSIDLLNSLGTGATFRELSTNALKSVQIPIPPLLEQKRIVKILEKAFKAIDKAKENAEKNLQNAKELFESYLNGIFEKKRKDWEEKRLKEISTIKYGYTDRASFNKAGPKFLRITDIQDGNVNWLNVPYCKISNDEINKYLLKDGDIVFARTGATTGKSYLISGEIPTAVFASYLIRVQINNCSLYSIFLYQFFQTSTYWKSVALNTSGSAQGGVNATKLGGLKIPIPPLPEQKRIVSELDTFSSETKRLEKIYQQKIADVEELKKSILQKAFEGGL